MHSQQHLLSRLNYILKTNMLIKSIYDDYINGRSTPEYFSHSSICALNGGMRHSEYIDKELLKNIMSGWPKAVYPRSPVIVPDPRHPHSLKEAMIIFENSRRNKSMWKGEYGKLRVELLDFIISSCEEKITSITAEIKENSND